MATTRTVHELLLDSTNVVRVHGLQDRVTRTFLDDADVASATLDLLDNASVAVPGATGLPMTFSAGTSPSSNEFRATISDSVALTLNAKYTAKIVVTAIDGSRRTFREPCIAVNG